MKTLNIKGQINDLAKSKLPANLKIEVWDKDAKNHDKLGTSFVDASGKFEINFQESDFKDHPADYAPDVYFKIFRGDKLIKNTEKEALKNLNDFTAELKVNINSNEMVPTLSRKTLGLKPMDLLEKKDETAESIQTLLNDALSDYIVSKIPLSNERARQVFAKLPVNFTHSHEHTAKDYVASEIARQIAETPELEETLNGLENQFSEKETIADILNLDQTVAENPTLKTAVRKTAFYNIGKSAQLSDENALKMSDLLLLNEGGIEAALAAAKSQKLTTKKNETTLRVGLYSSRLLGQDEALTDKIQQNTTIVAQATTVKPLLGLTKLDDAEWSELLKGNTSWKDAFPSKASYINALQEKVAAAYPSDTFLNQVTKTDKSTAKTQLTEIKSLLKNDQISFENWTHQSPNSTPFTDAQPTEQEHWKALQETANTYRYLGLPSILDDSSLTVTKKVQAIVEFGELLETFYRKNPDLDLRFADFAANEQASSAGNKPIDWKGVPSTMRKPLKQQLMAYQRIFRLTENPETALKLIQSGYFSAQELVRISITSLAEQLNISMDDAAIIQQQATTITEQVGFGFANVWERSHNGTTMNNSNFPAMANTSQVQQLEGYESHFGNQKFCSCEHCKSLYSPAAYFVDLMRFADQHISTPVFENLPNHPAQLKNRRPDLWKLPLNCENAHTLVPNLTISNAILEAYILEAKQEENAPFDVFEHLSTVHTTLQQPFNLNLAALHSWLQLKNVALRSMVETMGGTQERLMRASFGMSKEVYDLIIEPLGRETSTLIEIQQWLCVEDLEKMTLQQFLKQAHLTRAELDVLIGLPFFVEIGNIQITREQTPTDQLNQFTEFLDTSSMNSRDRIVLFDRMHRFLRLHSFTAWNMAELGFFLQEYNHWKEIQRTIDAEALFWLHTFNDLKNTWELRIDVLTTIWGNLPEEAISANSISVFDQLFNQDLGENEEIWSPSDLNDFQYDFFNQRNALEAPVQRDNQTDRILRALRLSEGQFLVLLQHLRSHININDAGKFSLSNHFEILHQHALLCRVLNLNVDQLFFLIQLSGNAEGALKSPEAIATFMQFVDALNLEYQDLSNLADYSLFQTSEREDLLHLYSIWQEAIFFTEDHLREIIPDSKKRSKWLEQMLKKGSIRLVKKSGYYFTEKYDPTGDASTQEMADKLAQFVPGPQLENAIRKVYSFADKHFENFEKAEDVHFDDPSLSNSLIKIWAVAEKESISLKERMALEENRNTVELAIDLIRKLRNSIQKVTTPVATAVPLLLLQEAGILSEPHVPFLKETLDIDLLTANSLLTIDSYFKTVPSSDENKRAEFNTLLENGFQEPLNRQAISESLSTLFDLDASLLLSALEITPWNNDTIQFVSEVLEKANLSEQLGINCATAEQLTSENYSDLTAAILSLKTGLRHQYDEQEWEAHLERVNDQLNEAKRDALIDYLIRNNDADFSWEFANANDLYAYFLIDSEMRSCGRTSYILSAISSVQLYIQRSMTNAEYQFFEENSVEVQPLDFSVLEYDLMNTEWEWRKNYRVWEANRKVFLYPENYLEPGLRDNKSPEFMELEDELLQRENNLPSAEQAFKKYFENVHNLSKLRIGGNYFDDATNTLFILGKTADNPIQYYIREHIDQREWSSWEKIDVSIDSEHVTPIVYKGKLYLFWVEEGSSQKTTLLANNRTRSNDKFIQYDLCYVYRKPSEEWSPTQYINMVNIRETDQNKEERFNKKLFLHIRNEELYVIHDSVFEPPVVVNSDYLNLPYRTIRKKIDLFNGVMNPVYFYDETYYLADIELPILSLENGTGSYSYGAELQAKLISSKVDDVVLYDLANGGINMNPISEEIDLPATQLGIDVIYNKAGDTILQENKQYYYVQSQRVDNYMNLQGAILPQNPFDDANPPLPIGLRLSNLSTTGIVQLDQIFSEEGLDALFTIDSQKLNEPATAIQLLSNPNLSFRTSLNLETRINFEGVYGNYYQEIFFHIPYTIANHFNASGKFKEAQQWYHYIFNPVSLIDENGVKNHWNYLPFRSEEEESFVEIFNNQQAIVRYKRDPFNPHAIARLRENAYKKAIFMKYVDNLLDWADQLFTRDTQEAINEALMLYLLASDILGEKPIELSACSSHEDANNPISYEQLSESQPNEFLYQLENMVGTGNATSGTSGQNTMLDPQSLLLFCIPNNEELFKYWDLLADRLFKIRNCQNIQGLTRQLPLFQPPIDPMLLIRAKAAGLSIDDALNSAGTMVNYRFLYLLEKAKSYASQVQQLGQSLLSALEKKDHEELQLLRSVQEQNMLQLSTLIRSQQIEEAKQQIAALQERRKSIEARHEWFTERIENNLSKLEISQQREHSKSIRLQQAASAANLMASISYQIPQFVAGITPEFEFGGIQLGGIHRSIGEQFNALSSQAGMKSSTYSVSANFERRKEDWIFQKENAQRELLTIDKEILAAEIRLYMNEKELENQETQIAYAEELYDFYGSKFSNLGFYDWMHRELTGLYSGVYQLAKKMAERAALAFEHQYGANSASTLISNHWEGNRQGLLSGEKLMQDLLHLETAYVEHQMPGIEIRQSFSLIQLNPIELMRLRETGECTFDIPQFAFDLLYPGHKNRKIKSVSMTIPAVTGPYVNVGCELSLLSDTAVGGNAIAVSHGVNDHGKFELSFNGERLMPFEGVDAVSSWNVKLPNHLRSFDYDSIGDIILHISYTAEQGDRSEREAVELALKNEILSQLPGNTLKKLISMKTEMPESFYQLNHGMNENSVCDLTLRVRKEQFPFFLADESLRLQSVKVFIKTDLELASMPFCNMGRAGSLDTEKEFEHGDEATLYPSATFSNFNSDEEPIGDWQFVLRNATSNELSIDDVFFVFAYDLRN